MRFIDYHFTVCNKKNGSLLIEFGDVYTVELNAKRSVSRKKIRITTRPLKQPGEEVSSTVCKHPSPSSTRCL
jgi:hypothetical protein